MTPGPLDSPLRRAMDPYAGELTLRYAEVLQAGDGGAAERVIEDALLSGMSPEAIQSLVITPAMVRIGELWEANVIGIAHEHLATSISHRSLVRLFEAMNAGPVKKRSRERVLLAAVEGQHHVLGLRMIADVLEARGFDVLYLGASVPAASLRELVAQHRPAVVGLAFGIDVGVEHLADAIRAIHELAADTRIMLGGGAIPRELRAAGYPCVEATTDVTAIVERLLAGPPQAASAIVERLRSKGPPVPPPHDRALATDVVAEQLARAADDAVALAREHVRRAETYRALAFRDPLTEMANRRAFEDALGAIVREPDATGCVLMIDVDEFKSINDEYGHDAGDRALRAVGRAIRAAVRREDFAARLGGDEFAVLLPGADTAAACSIGERIRFAIAESADPRVSISVGVASLAADSRAALLAADLALYDAKIAGRDRVVTASLSSAVAGRIAS